MAKKYKLGEMFFFVNRIMSLSSDQLDCIYLSLQKKNNKKKKKEKKNNPLLIVLRSSNKKFYNS